MSAARLVPLALSAVLIGLGGCGDDEKPAAGKTTTEKTTGPSGTPVATVEVSATDFKFSPANPGVQKTGVVAFEFSNDGQTVHALEVEGPDGEVKTDPVQPGKSQTIKADLNQSGRYTWYCPIADHRQRGMDGFVLVAGGGSGGSKPEDDSKRDDSGGTPSPY